MTREEAARVLKNIWTRYISTFDDIESEEVDALDTAIAALNEAGSPTTQLDENGLMPCGCGGKAMVDKGDAMYSGWYATCDECECKVGYDVDFGLIYGTFISKEQAKAAWNTAMGAKA